MSSTTRSLEMPARRLDVLDASVNRWSPRGGLVPSTGAPLNTQKTYSMKEQCPRGGLISSTRLFIHLGMHRRSIL